VVINAYGSEGIYAYAFDNPNRASSSISATIDEGSRNSTLTSLAGV